MPHCRKANNYERAERSDHNCVEIIRKMAGAFIFREIAQNKQVSDNTKKEKIMAKSKQVNHEYYANYETCRNRLFDLWDPDEEQNEDEHLDIYQAWETGEDVD